MFPIFHNHFKIFLSRIKLQIDMTYMYPKKQLCKKAWTCVYMLMYLNFHFINCKASIIILWLKVPIPSLFQTPLQNVLTPSYLLFDSVFVHSITQHPCTSVNSTFRYISIIGNLNYSNNFTSAILVPKCPHLILQ